MRCKAATRRSAAPTSCRGICRAIRRPSEALGTDAKCRASLLLARWPRGPLRGQRARLGIQPQAARDRGVQRPAASSTQFSPTPSSSSPKPGSRGGSRRSTWRARARPDLGAGTTAPTGCGSYQTAWSCLHKIRRALVHPSERRWPRVWRLTRPMSRHAGGLAGTRCRRRSSRLGFCRSIGRRSAANQATRPG